MSALLPFLNTVVTALAPSRVRFSASQFPTFKAMRDDYRASGILTVNTDHSDNTIFSDPSVNWRFRAWHDICHIQLDADFSQAGESRAEGLQVSQMYTAYGITPETVLCAALIDAEVNGQYEYFVKHGEFPTDQVACVLEFVARNYDLKPSAFDTLSAYDYPTSYARNAAYASLVPNVRYGRYR
jgi:hypothetical protein